MMKIGELVRSSFNTLIKNNALSSEEIDQLLQAKYSKQRFDVNYPILKVYLEGVILSNQQNINGYSRYYATLLRINGKKYLLCNDWYDKNRKFFLTWLSRFDSNIIRKSTEDSLHVPTQDHSINNSRKAQPRLIYNKLVRDRIPEVISKTGKKSITRILSDGEYKLELQKKLGEEIQEYIEAADDQNALEELADLLELIHAATELHGSSIQQLEQIRLKKAEERGGFKERIFLIEVTDA